jgi:hypothetical protein
LPKTSHLTICFGNAIANGRDGPGGELQHLQWYAPCCKVLMATEDGREVNRHIVFELQLEQKNDGNLREVAQKSFLMDGAAGQHYALKIFRVESVQYDPGYGLLCEQPVLLLSWQLRPGMGTESGGTAAHTARKRQFVTADARDHGRPQDCAQAKRARSEATPELE